MNVALLSFFLTFLRAYAFLSVVSAARVYLRRIGMLAVAAALALCVFPEGTLSTEYDKSHWSLLLLAARELWLGALLALPVAIAVESFLMAGRIADVTRGAQFSEQVAPGLAARVSPCESVAMLLVLLAALSLGGYRFVLLGLFGDFQPADSIEGMGAFPFAGSSVREWVQLSAKAIAAGLCAAAPVLLGSCLVEFAGVLSSRVLQRVSVSFELFPLKLLIGFAIFAWLCLEPPAALLRVLDEALAFEQSLVDVLRLRASAD